MGVLKVYISRGCRGYELAPELVPWVRKAKPSLNVEMVDFSATDDPQSGLRVRCAGLRLPEVLLGSQSQHELERWLDTL